MHEREFQRITRLRADQAVLREAAEIIRAAPSAHPPLAVLSDPRCSALLASMLDMAAQRLEYFPDYDRVDFVRVASDLCGRRMDQPRVRRTRRR